MNIHLRAVLAVLTLLAGAALPAWSSGPAGGLPASAQASGVQSRGLDIYFVDVEGGQSTLIVTPSRESLLIDAGYADFDGRDAERILRVAKLAGIDHIDFLLVTHYHSDHVGGVPQLAARIPIRVFLDHGRDTQTSQADRELYSAYLETAQKGAHRVVKPGDTIPLEGVQVVVVAGAGEHLQKALAGAGQANPYCAETKPMAADPTENSQSLGLVLTYGKFRFVDLGDLTWNKELALMCPANPLGTADVLVASHHAGANANSKALVWALRPRVTIINNAPKKGGSPEAWKRIHDAPGRERIWQLHDSVEGGKQYNAGPDYVANGEEKPDQGNYLKLTATPDSGFTMTNSRNGFKVTYPPRN